MFTIWEKWICAVQNRHGQEQVQVCVVYGGSVVWISSDGIRNRACGYTGLTSRLNHLQTSPLPTQLNSLRLDRCISPRRSLVYGISVLRGWWQWSCRCMIWVLARMMSRNRQSGFNWFLTWLYWLSLLLAGNKEDGEKKTPLNLFQNSETAVRIYIFKSCL